MTASGISLSGVEAPPPADLARRIWDRDSGAWGPGDDDPADRLGWLTLPADLGAKTESLHTFVAEAAGDAEAVVLLGMGGSSLAPEVFARSLGASRRLIVGDSTHPSQILADRASLDLDRCVFVVSSKSGGTIETLSLYRYYRSLVPDGDKFVAVTDPGTSLERLARDEGFAKAWLNPPDIGGRYSALSYFGLVPATLVGVEIEPLLDDARAAAEACGPDVDPAGNPGLVVGAAIARLALQGRDKLTFALSDPLASFGDWVEQLLAESTGKHGKGIAPIVREPRAPATAYGKDRAFVVMKLPGDDRLDTFGDELRSAGHPVVTIDVESPTGLGGQMFVWEFATAVAGSLLGINAFDQPNVESAKKASRELLESGDELSWSDGDPSALFEGMGEGELAVVCAFAPRSPGAEDVLESARHKLVDNYGVATMAGFGPRYLHSTGQLHKGGPPGVRALVVLDEPAEDVPIPGGDYTFGRLVKAQAEGDARALEQAGRNVRRTRWRTFESWARSS